MTKEEFAELGFRTTLSDNHWLIGVKGANNLLDHCVQVTGEPGQPQRWSFVDKDGHRTTIPAPKDINGVYRLLEVFDIPFTRLKTTWQKLVAFKWLPTRDGEFRTVPLGGTGANLYYRINSNGPDDLFVTGGASRIHLLDDVTPEHAQKIFLVLSGQ